MGHDKNNQRQMILFKWVYWNEEHILILKKQKGANEMNT